MNDDTNAVVAILFIFIISLGIIFFFNITVRYFGSISRFQLFLIIIIMGFSLGYVVSLISYQQSLPEVRDLQRETDLQLIADGLDAYFNSQEYDKALYVSIPKCPVKEYIGTTEGAIDLVSILEDNYLSQMPMDPFAKTTANTFYTICINKSLRIEVSAPKSETSDVISVIK